MVALADILRRYPELALFLTLGLGYLLGRAKLGRVPLGAVTGTLITGLLVGQLNIALSADVRSIFFLMFIFAVGYGAGPQFFRGLKRDGLSQVAFAVVICLACLLSAFFAALVLRLDPGSAAGLLSGACTTSAVIGVGTDSINQLGIPAAQKAAFIGHIPVAFAVTYIFGTAGSAWFLASLGPKLLRVDLPAECRRLEEQMGAGQPEPGVTSAYTRLSVRAYEVTAPGLANSTIATLETDHASKRVYVERIRHHGKVEEATPETVIREGDVLALMSTRTALLEMENIVGLEVDDKELIDFPAASLDVVVTNKAVLGPTLQELAEAESGRHGRGVFVRKLMRGGAEMPVTPRTKLDRGDVLTLAGAKRDVERAAKLLGYADRPTDATDMVFVGVGILLGGLVGAVSFKIGRVPLSLSTSGGALLMGLVFGWLRSVHPTFGRIPAPALWVMENVGCTAFIAAVGISAGPSFVAGVKTLGLVLLFAGVWVTLMPLVVGLFVGKYFFKMHPALILGACAGARTTTAALTAIQDVAHSRIPALGYTIAYAVGNTLLIVWGVVIVMLIS